MKNLNQLQGNLVGKDFSFADRARMLRSLSKPKKQRDRVVAPGVKASMVWNQDVSGSDRRSVKAQLAGRGDYRPLWWNLNVLVHRLFNRAATTEEIMYSFHKRHQGFTLQRLEAQMDFNELQADVAHNGIASGWRTKINQLRRKAHRD